jgi:hypothetical protein
MSEKKRYLGPFTDRLANGDVTAAECEAFCAGVYMAWQDSTDKDYYQKMYDPMTIDEDKKIAHSYVFDLNDGGRHHSYESLEQVCRDALKQAVACIIKFYTVESEEPQP